MLQCRRPLKGLTAALAVAVLLAGSTPSQAFSVSEGTWSADCGADGCAMRTRNTEGDLLFLIGIRNSQTFSAGIRFSAPVADLSEAITLSTGGGYTSFLPQDDYAVFGPAGDLYLIEPAKTARLVDQFGPATTLEVNYANADPSTGQSGALQFSLSGFSAVYQAVKRELGTGSAKVAFAAPPGLERADMPPAAHHISQGAAPGAIVSSPAPDGIPQVVFDMHLRISDCEALSGGTLRGVAPQSARMTETAIIHAIPCIASAAGTTWRLYQIETGEIGGVRPLTLARYSPKFGWVGMLEPANVTLDPAAPGLTASRTGQGSDDCGYRGTWVYEDFDLKLVRFEAAARCGAMRQVWPAN
jgi:hypothetical protein